jgi:hypothetical protein
MHSLLMLWCKSTNFFDIIQLFWAKSRIKSIDFARLVDVLGEIAYKKHRFRPIGGCFGRNRVFLKPSTEQCDSSRAQNDNRASKYLIANGKKTKGRVPKDIGRLYLFLV